MEKFHAIIGYHFKWRNVNYFEYLRILICSCTEDVFRLHFLIKQIERQ